MQSLFSLEGQVAVVTGGSGSLGGAMARGLAGAGARVGVLGRRRPQAEDVAEEIAAAGAEAMALVADVLHPDELDAACAAVLDRWGQIDILVNAAGGNVPGATLAPDASFFDMSAEAIKAAIDLNLMGTILPCQVFGRAMAEYSAGKSRSIVNISSLAADRILTRVIGYGAAKAGVENFTRWLAVEMSRRKQGIRVNAIAPGFFIGDQNRRLLFDADGVPTERTQTILSLTPAARLGQPEELIGTVVWLCSPAASFVTGAVIHVDGGFSAFSGV